MAFSPPTHNNGHAQITPFEEETLSSAQRLRPARRTPSFSSSSPSNSWDSSFGSSSFISFNDEYPPFSPITPLKLKGIPFSWERMPGIPKQQSLKKKEYTSGDLLPLPPAVNSNSITKKLLHQEEISPKKHHTSTTRFQRDPFLAALVECSKDDDDNDNDDEDDDDDRHGSNFGNIMKGSSKITRSLSDRFGFINMYASCKRTCTVSESIVYIPRSSSPRYLLNRR